ncbi:STAS domain-containing protein [Nocardia grenadensis]|uniref:STAS domain-containing protein n=1 Tax=Nocardia grenadensis TaxID=931537 RepID=UPI003D74DB74
MHHEDRRRDFTVGVLPDGASVTVTATGEIDIHTAPRLHEALTRAMDDRPRTLILDLSAVGFFDSSGLKVLLGCRDEAPDLRLAVSPAVRRVIEVTGLTEHFQIFDSIAAAIA